MPDFDLVIEIVKYYNVSIDEILDGEMKNHMIDKKTEQALLKVSDYESLEKTTFKTYMRIVYCSNICLYFILCAEFYRS